MILQHVYFWLNYSFKIRRSGRSADLMEKHISDWNKWKIVCWQMFVFSNAGDQEQHWLWGTMSPVMEWRSFEEHADLWCVHMWCVLWTQWSRSIKAFSVLVCGNPAAHDCRQQLTRDSLQHKPATITHQHPIVQHMPRIHGVTRNRITQAPVESNHEEIQNPKTDLSKEVLIQYFCLVFQFKHS